jgi:hypothetical protein
MEEVTKVGEIGRGVTKDLGSPYILMLTPRN